MSKENDLEPSNKIKLSNSRISKAGRGVFATREIRKGEIIESCPVFVLPIKDYPIARKTKLRNYYFMWGGKTTAKTSAICFGYGSLYNHSFKPNATYKKRIKKQLIDFVAIRRIKKGQEITVNYNYGKPNSKGKEVQVWLKLIGVSKVTKNR